MMGYRLLDRYVIRQVLPPFAVALVALTLTLQLRPLTQVAEVLIARGIEWRDVSYLMALLLPQALALTIPLSLLAGVLVAFVRISADREYVAMQACGISLYRLLPPIAALGLAGAAVSAAVSLWGAPASARAFREHAFEMIVKSAEGEARPRVFIDAFPGRVVYMRDIIGGRWKDVFIADSFDPRLAAVYVANSGRIEVDRVHQRLSLVLEDGSRHVASSDDPAKYELALFKTSVVDFNWAAVFPPGLTEKTLSEMHHDELIATAAAARARGESGADVLLELHRRFAIPVACLLLPVLGLALAASTAGTGRLMSFAVAGGVVLIHYMILFTGRSLALRGHVDAWVTVWLPTAITGLIAAALLVWRAGGGRDLPFSAPSSGERWWRGAIRRFEAMRDGRLLDVRMRILDRYVARLYVAFLALMCATLLSLSYVLIVTDLATDAFRSTGMVWLLLQYCVFEIPQVLYFVLPMSTLMAALVTIGVLTRNSEIIVMKACGISLYRMAVPLFLLGLVTSAALFAIQETILPDSNRRAEQVRAVIRGHPDRGLRQLNRAWVMGRDGAIYHYRTVDLRRRTLGGLSIFEFAPTGWEVRRRLFIGEAIGADVPHDEETSDWTMANGRIWDLSQRERPVLVREFDREPMRLESIEYFRRERPEAERMAYLALSRYIEDLRASGTNVSPYVVTLRRKLSFPFITIIMVLIAVPFGVTTGKRGALYGVGAGVVLSFGYWAMMSVFGALGSSGAMSPALAAWAPNLLFGAGASYLVLTTRT